MKKYRKTILIVGGLIAAIGISFFIYKSVNYKKIAFIKKTGFYFDGITANDPDSIYIYGICPEINDYYKQRIPAYQQYRKTDIYIWEPWRKNTGNISNISNIYIEIHDTIWNKINTIYFKTGNIVLKYNNAYFYNQWFSIRKDKIIIFKSPQKVADNISSTNTLLDGFKAYMGHIIYMNHNIIIKAKHLFYCYLLFLVILSILVTYDYLYKILWCFIRKSHTFFIKHKKIFKKILVFFLGLLFSLLILETSLRIFGHYHKKQNIDKNYTLAKNTKNHIICLGDSFTEGCGASLGHDYPNLLNQLIQQQDSNNYQILNFGQSGKNTTQIKLEFLHYLNEESPKLVILMAGSANYWNKWGLGEKAKFIYEIRTFKLIKLLYNSLINKNNETTSLLDSITNSEAYLMRRTKYSRTLNITSLQNKNTYFKELIQKQDIKLIQNYADSIFIEKETNYEKINELIYFSILTNNVLDFSGLDYTHIPTYYKELITIITQLNNDTINITNDTIKILYNYYLANASNDNELKINYLLQCLNICPYFEDAYYELNLINYNSIPKPPEDFWDKAICFTDSITFYKNKIGLENTNKGMVFIEDNYGYDSDLSRTNRWIENELEDIILACKAKGSQIIIMTYPISYYSQERQYLNEILKKLSYVHNLPLIDNETIFEELGNNKNQYFVSDGHCSDKGNLLIAKEIYKLIKQLNLLNNK